MKKTSNLLHFLYLAAPIIAALGIAVFPLIPPFGTLKTSDFEIIQNKYLKIALSAF